ncbi:hypothetical protein Q8A73_000166 [Channa argus]|nr:hypothetical protein Q8A73_000166 [Channa argus]
MVTDSASDPGHRCHAAVVRPCCFRWKRDANPRPSGPVGRPMACPDTGLLLLTQEAWIPAKRRHRRTPAAANLVNQSIGPPSPVQVENRFTVLEELERPTSLVAVPCDSLPREIPHSSTARGQRGRGLTRPDVPPPPTPCLQRGIHMLLLGAPLHRTVLPVRPC